MHFETTWERKRFQARTLFKDAWVCTSDSNYYITLHKDKDPDYEKKLSQWVKGCCKLLRTGATERLLEILSVDSTDDLPISLESKQRIQNSIEAPNQMADHIKERVSNVLNTDGKDEKQKAFDKIIPKIIISSTMAHAAKNYYKQYGLQVLGSN